MFLCEECHKDSNCNFCQTIEILKSYGACGMCHKVTVCYDCHNYNFRKTKAGEIKNETLIAENNVGVSMEALKDSYDGTNLLMKWNALCVIREIFINALSPEDREKLEEYRNQ